MEVKKPITDLKTKIQGIDTSGNAKQIQISFPFVSASYFLSNYASTSESLQDFLDIFCGTVLGIDNDEDENSVQITFGEVN